MARATDYNIVHKREPSLQWMIMDRLTEGEAAFDSFLTVSFRPERSGLRGGERTPTPSEIARALGELLDAGWVKGVGDDFALTRKGKVALANKFGPDYVALANFDEKRGPDVATMFTGIAVLTVVAWGLYYAFGSRTATAPAPS